MSRRRPRWRARLTRDTAVFCLGALGFAHEVLLNPSVGERPTLLLICAAMMGLPVFLRADERRHDDEDGTP